jgi:hypothetical protein
MFVPVDSRPKKNQSTESIPKPDTFGTYHELWSHWGLSKVILWMQNIFGDATLENCKEYNSL